MGVRVPRTDRGLRVLAVGVALLTVGLAALQGVLYDGLADEPELVAGHSGTNWGPIAFALCLGAAGLLVALHRPRNAVGWWMLLPALAEVVCDTGAGYGARALARPEDGLPLGDWVLATTAPLWMWSVILPVTCLLLRYPSGRLQGRWARRLDRAALVGLGSVWVAYAGSDASVSDSVRGGTTPLPVPDLVAAGCGAVGLLLVALSAVGALVHSVVRLRRAVSPERQQLLWLLSVAPVASLLVFTPWEWTQKVGYLIPFTVVVGVVRYRLLGIDVVVRRSLLYGSLTALVLLVFATVTAGLARVAPDGDGALLLASGVVAVGVIPARDRLQRQVDRLVYGDRGDPIAALRRVARPVSDAEGAALVRDLLGAVALAVRAPWGHVVTASGALVEVGDAADTGAACVRRPLTVGGEEVGELALGLRRGESRLPAADDRLLEALTPVLAVVLRGAELTARVRVEQARALAATGVERDRLRRDLHDGLGPALTGMGLGLEALEARHGASPLLDRLRTECSGALEEVRRILDDLRPAALDDDDLLEAVRSRVARWEATSDVPVHLTLPERAGPVAAADATVVRILDEALTNVAKHAHATRCDVGLEVDLDAGTMVLRVRDDGVGVGDGVREGAVGLASMRARAEALGGELRVEPAGPGTCVVARLPVPHGALT